MKDVLQLLFAHKMCRLYASYCRIADVSERVAAEVSKQVTAEVTSGVTEVARLI